jgi:hypothetical protein
VDRLGAEVFVLRWLRLPYAETVANDVIPPEIARTILQQLLSDLHHSVGNFLWFPRQAAS